MQRPITRGASAGAGLIFHVFASDSASTTGAGKASIAYSAFSCRYIRNGEAISGAITPEDITTIGTYQAPTANTNIRIKAVDNTNMIGIYEVHVHADWVNATNLCQSLTIYLTATGVAVLPIQVPLQAFDLQTATQPVNVTQIGGDTQSLADLKDFADAGYDPGTNKVQGVVLVDTITAYTGNTPQTGDSFARIGAAGAGLTSLASAPDLATLATYVDTEVAAIKAKTDNLPTDPADQSLIESAITSATSPLATASALATVAGYLDTEIAAILAKVNPLPTDPADQSAVEASITAATSPLSTLTAADIRTAIGLVAANLDTQLAALPTATENADGLLDLSNGIETGWTLRQALRIAMAALAGEGSGMATSTAVYRNVTDTKARITATVDADGNRTAVVYDKD